MTSRHFKTWTSLLLGAACVMTFGACGDDAQPAGDGGNGPGTGPGGKGDTAGDGTSTNSTSTGSGMDTSTVADTSMVADHPALQGDPGCSGKVVRFDGKVLTDAQIKELDDPFARWVLRAGDGCPTGFSEVVKKLQEFDTGNCESPGDGTQSMLISESAQIMDRPTDYRVVTSRKCNTLGSRDDHGLLFSMFGVGAVDDTANPDPLPQQVEVMGFDKERGIFNYYEIKDDGNMEFFGNSVDLLKKNNGLGGQAGRCAGCHISGGAVMKELDTPWVHWEGHHTTPGAAEVVTAHKDELGRKSSGSTMEGITKRANSQWNDIRLKTLLEGGTAQDVLRPLFCSLEVNLDNGADFATNTTVDFGADFFLDPAFGAFGTVSVDVSQYKEVLERINQRLDTGSGPLKSEEEVVRDTIFLFTFIERSHVDNDYVKKMVDSGVIDKEFMLDVLNVDMTRPVLSDERCALLKHVPAQTLSAMNFEEIKAGLAKNLEGIKSPNAFEKALLENLTNEERDGAAHIASSKSFLTACGARDKAALLDDIMKVLTLTKNIAKSESNPVHSVFEFSLTMPISDLKVKGRERLDPVSCKLK